VRANIDECGEFGKMWVSNDHCEQNLANVANLSKYWNLENVTNLNEYNI
jgi:hypothetical protein